MATATATVMATGADRDACRQPQAIRRPSPIPVDRFRLRSDATRAAQGCAVWMRFFACIGCVAAVAPAFAENWKFTPSASVTGTYTSNVDYVAQGSSNGDFSTSVGAALGISGEGRRAKLNGSISATGLFYARQTENNSFAPTVNLTGNLEAIENFAFIEAQANVAQTFNSPFGPQPGNIVNATANRYTSQTYALSPYIKGKFGGSNVSYEVRDDNIWSIASQFGDASVEAPDNTYLNRLRGVLESPAAPWGWLVEYVGTRYSPSGQDIYRFVHDSGRTGDRDLSVRPAASGVG